MRLRDLLYNDSIERTFEWKWPSVLMPSTSFSSRIQSGEYATASELIEEALSLLRYVPRWTDADLRHEVKLGVDQLARGESADWDAEELKRRVRETAKRQ